LEINTFLVGLGQKGLGGGAFGDREEKVAHISSKALSGAFSLLIQSGIFNKDAGKEPSPEKKVGRGSEIGGGETFGHREVFPDFLC